MGQVLTQPIQSQLLQRRGNEQFKVGFAEMHGFRMSMEDCHTIAPKLSERHKSIGLFAVFDGHAGDRAAIFLEAELHKRVAALEDPTEEKQLSECVQQLDADFLTDEQRREDGSTCTFCVVAPVEDAAGPCWEVTAVNVGDSRSIIIKADGTCVGLTNDHKPEDELEDARIRAAGGTVQMNRVDGQLAMSRAIGDWQYKSNPELAMHLQKVNAVPEIIKGRLYAGDRLLICCDGIVEQMSSEDASDFSYGLLQKQAGLEAGQDLARICWELNKYSLRRGSKDNHSCMIIDPHSGEAYKAKDEFVPGPFHPYKQDQAFRDAYLTDAKKHGYEGEVLMEMAREIEAGMPELANLPVVDDEAAGQQPIMGLQALHALINQPGDPADKWSMIGRMLSSQGAGGAAGAEGAEGDDAQ